MLNISQKKILVLVMLVYEAQAFLFRNRPGGAFTFYS